MRRFYDALKCLYGPQSSKNTPILSADDSKLIIDKKGILERRAEHFNGVLNRPSKINDEAIQRLLQVEINKDLDALPSVDEVARAIKHMATGKTQVLMLYRQKYSNQVVFHSPKDSLICFVRIGKMKRSHKHLKKLPLYTFLKRKGNKRTCDNHRGISSQLRERSWLVFS